MKKLKSFLIGTAILAVSVVPVFANVSGIAVTEVSTSGTISEEVYVAGDPDNNGVVELSDAQLTLKIALKIIKEPTAQQIAAADVDKNGVVELLDAQKVLKVALKIDQTF